MRNQILVKRYAQAYIDFAKPVIGLERCVQEMKSLKWLLREEPDFGLFLKAPEVPRADKTRVLNNVLAADYSEQTLIFINYLIIKERVFILSRIADQVRLLYSHQELVDVVIRTTFPLELDLLTRIKDKLELRLQKKANLYFELNPDLLGGVQIEIGHTLIDGSVRHRLLELKKTLLKSQVV